MSDWPKSSLHNHPDIAQQVGLVVADYAVLEACMFLVYAAMADKPKEAFRRFYELRHSHLREELMLKTAAKYPEPIQKALSRLWRRFKAAARRRTEIAHVSFLSDGKTVTRMRLYNTKPKFEAVSLGVFQRTFSQYRTLCKDLLIFAGLLTPSVEAVHQLVDQLPLAQFRQTQVASMAALDPQAKFQRADRDAALARLKLLDWLEENHPSR